MSEDVALESKLEDRDDGVVRESRLEEAALGVAEVEASEVALLASDVSLLTYEVVVACCVAIEVESRMVVES